MKTFCTLLLIFLMACSSPRAGHLDARRTDGSAPKVIPGMKLVWHDEFNEAGKPNPANWRYETGFERNEELQWYQSDNANCKDGVLLIEARREAIPNPNYQAGSKNWKTNRPASEFTSASIQTRGLQQWQYGRFEIRARIDTTYGSWPAIWTLGNGPWPNAGEIDIMEFYQVKETPTILANFAWLGDQVNRKTKWNEKKIALANFTTKDKDWVKKFHTWRMDWTEESIQIFLDDELLNTQSLKESLNPDGSNPFLKPQFLLLNLAIGRNGGTPKARTSKIVYEVDYVRVYQRE